jgi:parallel beta-helix repeat protein
MKAEQNENFLVQQPNPGIHTKSRLGTFAFYYPWYRTPDGSGKWYQWNASDHDPNRITNEKRDIATAHYPLSGVYDSSNESVIKEHIDIAKEAGIDGFIVSWWGIRTFEDNTSLRIRNVCEQNNFTFTFYYESTSSINQTEDELTYIFNNYANSSAYYKIDGRPVIYVYSRARDNLKPKAWRLYGNNIEESKSAQDYWWLVESIRRPARYGIFPIEPEYGGIGYIESAEPIFLPPNETYVLKVGISDMRNDAGEFSDVGFRIKIKNGTEWRSLLDDTIVNFSDGWLDLNFSISEYAGQNVSIRAESFAGGMLDWNSEWAAVDYFYIENSKAEIVSPEPFFDNGWKTVADRLKSKGLDFFLCMDFGAYEGEVQHFAEYFLNFTDGIHTYSPISFSQRISKILQVYNQGSNIASLKNKIFVATVMPGFNNSALSKDQPVQIIDRYNGTYYRLSWSIAKACSPDGYAITSFNEWLEGTEIESSLEYGHQYIDLTRNTPNILTVDANKPADFTTIQEAINNASPGDAVVVSEGTYAEGQINVTKSLILLANGTATLNGLGEKSGIYVTADNVAIDGFNITNVNANYWRIKADNAKDVIIMENNVADNSGYGGIFLSNCKECLLRYNNASQSGASGIELHACNNVVVMDNGATNSSYGIRLTNSNNNIIAGNNVTANKATGICLTNSSTFNSIFANSIAGNGFGIDLLLSSNDNTISENTVANNTHGVRLWSSLNNTVYVNNVTGNNGHGILFRNSSSNTIAGNNITKNKETGIFLDMSSTNSISGNKIANNTVGIWLSNSSNNTLYRNTIANNHDGICLYASSNHSGISENNISTNTEYGIVAENSSESSILANAITRNEKGAKFSHSGNNKILANNIAENEIVGLELYNSCDNVISLNNIYGSNRSGISIEYFSSNNILSLNNVTRNIVGIGLYELSTNNTFFGNNLEDNNRGIDIHNSTENMFYHNNFLNNTQNVANALLSKNDWDAGYSIGGNYWSNYPRRDVFSGPFQNETGYDWVGDLPYVIDQVNTDRYPLMQPFVPEMEEIRTAYRSLLIKNIKMSSVLDSLNSTLYELIGNFTDLQVKYDSLQNKTNTAQEQIADLNLTCKELQRSLDNLKIEFNSTRDSLQKHVNFLYDQINNIINRMYIFMSMTAILIATTVYLAVRKPKTKTET